MGLFGLPFFVAGLIMLAIVTRLIPLAGPQPGWSALAVLGVMALVFTSVGAVLVFGQTWVIIDLAARQVSVRKGVLTPITRRSWPLDHFDAVSLAFERGDSDTADAFPVRLTGPADLIVDIVVASAWPEARACALAVSRHASLPLREAASDHATMLAPAEADHSLLQRLRRAGVVASATVPARATTRCRAVEAPDRAEVFIQQPEVPGPLRLLGLIPVAAALGVLQSLHVFFGETHTPPVVGWFFLLFVGLGFGALPLGLMVLGALRAPRGHAVIVDRGGLRIEQRRGRRVYIAFEAALDEVLDIDFSSVESAVDHASWEADARLRAGSPSGAAGRTALRLAGWLARHARGRGVTIKSRQQVMDVGGHLSDDEVRYVAEFLRSALLRMK